MRSSIVVQVLHNLIYLFLFTCFFFLFEVFLFFLRFFFFLVGFTTILGPASSVGSSVPIMLGTHLFRVKYHICVESCAAAAVEAPAAAEEDSDLTGVTSWTWVGVLARASCDRLLVHIICSLTRSLTLNLTQP